MPKPAYVKGLLWGLFSATAFFSAFVLPVHIFALLFRFTMRFDAWYFKAYFFFIFAAALYHGLYRMKTILKDLKVL